MNHKFDNLEQSKPNHLGDTICHPNHPSNPQPPVGPMHPEKPYPPVGPTRPDKPVPPVGPTRPEPPEKPDIPITIIVNGTDKILPRGTKVLSYEDVVRLAYGNYSSSSNIIYSVSYSNGPNENRKGVLVKGDSVYIRKEMIFNVGCSNKS